MTAEVVERIVTRFGCSTCRKSWASKYPARRHVIAGCIHDPEVRACASCKHDYRGEEQFCEIDARPEYETFVRQCSKWCEK